jgi:Chromate resistance exported protein
MRERARMDGQESPSASLSDLDGATGTSALPLIFDMRRSAGSDADDRIPVGVLRRAAAEVGQRAHEVPPGRSVDVYWAEGHEVSQETAVALQGSSIDARYREGGIAGWAELALPLRNKRAAGAGIWLTRERPKIDHIARPWLICRFIEPEALFLFAPTERVLHRGRRDRHDSVRHTRPSPFQRGRGVMPTGPLLRGYQ